MQTGVPQYEDFVNKAAKLHSHLKYVYIHAKYNFFRVPLSIGAVDNSAPTDASELTLFVISRNVVAFQEKKIQVNENCGT